MVLRHLGGKFWPVPRHPRNGCIPQGGPKRTKWRFSAAKWSFATVPVAGMLVLTYVEPKLGPYMGWIHMGVAGMRDKMRKNGDTGPKNAHFGISRLPVGLLGPTQAPAF